MGQQSIQIDLHHMVDSHFPGISVPGRCIVIQDIRKQVPVYEFLFCAVRQIYAVVHDRSVFRGAAQVCGTLGCAGAKTWFYRLLKLPKEAAAF